MQTYSLFSDELKERGEEFFKEETEQSEEYKAFLKKFEGKKTTDDCFTPPLVYEAVADWVAAEYGVDKGRFVRPFFPDGDFEAYPYEADAIVVDNPPFSILAKILRFYDQEGIAFFLFGPTLTLFSSSCAATATAIAVGVGVTYDNGANVNTSFITNMEPDNIRVRTAPTLYTAVKEANAETQRQLKKELPKYAYPDNIITGAMVARWSKYGVDFRVTRDEALPLDAMDAQKATGAAIFGKGFLLGSRAAAERAAAERAEAHRWELSETEREIVAYIDKRVERLNR